MGVDWIPCRVELDCPTQELVELVQCEAIHFRTGDNSIASTLDSRIQFTDSERKQIRDNYVAHGPLHRWLLFKFESHPISVITSEVLFPIEWRTEAERTILPGDLHELVAKWQNYRDETLQGKHRPFLWQLYIYAQLQELAICDVANLIGAAQYSLSATGSWANRPEVAACRDEILTAPILTLRAPPRWPSGGGETDLNVAERTFDRIEALVTAWNQAVRRGNVRLRPPQRPLSFEQWILSRLNDDYFSTFLAWLHPWKERGYGLYRDCEGTTAVATH